MCLIQNGFLIQKTEVIGKWEENMCQDTEANCENLLTT